jgi:hypothetical protein
MNSAIKGVFLIMPCVHVKEGPFYLRIYFYFINTVLSVTSMPGGVVIRNNSDLRMTTRGYVFITLVKLTITQDKN